MQFPATETQWWNVMAGKVALLCQKRLKCEKHNYPEVFWNLCFSYISLYYCQEIIPHRVVGFDMRFKLYFGSCFLGLTLNAVCLLLEWYWWEICVKIWLLERILFQHYNISSRFIHCLQGKCFLLNAGSLDSRASWWWSHLFYSHTIWTAKREKAPFMPSEKGFSF